MEFTSSYNNTNTDRTTAKRTFTQTKEKFKGAAKKPKVKKESDEAASLDAEVKPISEKEKSVLEKGKIAVKDLSDKVEENHTTLKDEKLKDFVPPYLLPKLAEVLVKATSFQADVALVMESGVGNFKKMKAAEKEVKLALSDAKKKSAFFITENGGDE